MLSAHTRPIGLMMMMVDWAEDAFGDHFDGFVLMHRETLFRYLSQPRLHLQFHWTCWFLFFFT